MGKKLRNGQNEPEVVHRYVKRFVLSIAFCVPELFNIFSFNYRNYLGYKLAFVFMLWRAFKIKIAEHA